MQKWFITKEINKRISFFNILFSMNGHFKKTDYAVKLNLLNDYF